MEKKNLMKHNFENSWRNDRFSQRLGGPVWSFSAQRVEHLKPKTRLLTQDLTNLQDKSKNRRISHQK